MQDLRLPQGAPTEPSSFQEGAAGRASASAPPPPPHGPEPPSDLDEEHFRDPAEGTYVVPGHWSVPAGGLPFRPCLYLAAASRQLSSWALSDPCKGFGLSRRWSFSGHSRKPKGLLGTEVGGSGE